MSAILWTLATLWAIGALVWAIAWGLAAREAHTDPIRYPSLYKPDPEKVAHRARQALAAPLWPLIGLTYVTTAITWIRTAATNGHQETP